MGNSTSYLHELFKSASILSGGWMFTGDLLNFSLFPVVDQLVLHVVFCVFCVSQWARGTTRTVFTSVWWRGRWVSSARSAESAMLVRESSCGRDVCSVQAVRCRSCGRWTPSRRSSTRPSSKDHTEVCLRHTLILSWGWYATKPPGGSKSKWFNLNYWLKNEERTEWRGGTVFNISSSSSSSFSSRQHLLHQTSCRWVTHHAHSSICCHLQGDIILDSDGLFLKPQNGTKFPRIWVTSLRLGWAPC